MPRTLEELVLGSAENGRRFAEMFEQLPHAHGADVLDHVQRDQRFPGIHHGWIPDSTFAPQACSGVCHRQARFSGDF